MIIKIILALCAAAVIILIVYLARAAMLTPVHVGENECLEIQITVSGPAPELENTVESLLWLMENGTVKADISVVDAGMDEETRLMAQILERRGHLTLKS